MENGAGAPRINKQFMKPFKLHKKTMKTWESPNEDQCSKKDYWVLSDVNPINYNVLASIMV